MASVTAHFTGSLMTNGVTFLNSLLYQNKRRGQLDFALEQGYENLKALLFSDDGDLKIVHYRRLAFRYCVWYTSNDNQQRQTARKGRTSRKGSRQPYSCGAKP